MNTVKIGNFLKALRQERGLTQEQLGEKIGVAGRTVSRWETASNMPDLSILIQLSEFYGVTIDEIIDGVRKKDTDEEFRETLIKIADYSKDEKQNAVNIYKYSLMVMFFTGFIIVMIEFAMLSDIKYVLLQSLPLLSGGCVCVALTVKNGLWDTFSKATISNDVCISFTVASVGSIFTFIMLLHRQYDLKRVIIVTLWFFAISFSVGVIILRLLAFLNVSKKNK